MTSADDSGGEPATASWAATMALSKLSRTLKQLNFSHELNRLTALSVVCDHGPISVSDLSSLEGVSCATMSRTVAALQQSGLVRCDSNGEDRRAVFVKSTAKGRTTLKRGADQSRKRMREVLGSLDEKSLRALRDLVQTIEQLDQRS